MNPWSTILGHLRLDSSRSVGAEARRVALSRDSSQPWMGAVDRVALVVAEAPTFAPEDGGATECDRRGDTEVPVVRSFSKLMAKGQPAWWL
jgi:hypothetical protein